MQFSCGGKSVPPKTEPAPVPAAAPLAPVASEEVKELEKKIAQFAAAELTAPIDGLPESERKTLALLIEASRLLDPVFDRQAYAGNPALADELARDESPLGQARLRYFRIMRGPWDRQEEFKPFAIDKPHVKGAGFYPEDLSADDFKAYVDSHPDKKAALESLFTVVRRDGSELTAVPYSQAYREWLAPAAAKLEEAAATTQNKSLARFLKLRAKAFLQDDYYESDKAWMDVNSSVEVTIGPYETYEDELLGLKASFESFVTVIDPKASSELAHFKELLPKMEANLPIPKGMRTKRGADSPIRVADVVFTAGDARKSVQTIAFNLPNDEKVRKEKGAKKVLLRNLIQTKFDRILRPLAGRILDESLLPSLSAEAFFYETLFHELSHSLGPAFAKVGKKEEDLRLVFGVNATPLEEAKADVMGAWNILYLIDRKEFPPEFRQKLLVSYFAGLFRSVRFGVAEAHGKGAALQIGRFLASGAATFDRSTARFRIDEKKLEESIRDLVKDICVLQRTGDVAGVEKLLATYGVMSEEISLAVGNLGDIPVDIFPVYPLAESKP